MRIALLLVLAGTAAPLLAQPGDGFRRSGDRREAPVERVQRAPSAAPDAASRQSVARQARPRGDSRRVLLDSSGYRASPNGMERPAQALPDRPRRRLDRADPSADLVLQRIGQVARPDPVELEPTSIRPRSGDGGPVSRGPKVVDAPRGRNRTGDSVADWRLRDRGIGASPELVRQRDGSVPSSMEDRRQRLLDRFARGETGGYSSPVVSREPREGTQPPPPAAARPARYSASHWRGDWRRDRRYDWADWRRRNHSHFRLGFYFDPFGWSYRRYHAGWRLWPSYYSRSYWLSDPWSYRLPHAPPPYRWIRYHRDALLVDIWSGQVVDVIHDFFW